MDGLNGGESTYQGTWEATMRDVNTVKESKIAGTCPACGFIVLFDEPDGPVWTCPADLSGGNPKREEAHPNITEALRDKSGVYSNCGEDFGFPCYDRLPLHSACYDKGNY